MNPEQKKAVAIASARKRMFAEQDVAHQKQAPHGGPLGTPLFQKPRPDIQKMPIQDAPQGPGFFESMRLGTFDNVQTQIDALAKSRFPNIPLQQSRDRYGVVGGNIVYVDDEGKMNKEISGVGRAGQVIGEHGPAVVGGTIGGIYGGPGGAALGAAGGESWKKNFAMSQGERQGAVQNLTDIGIEAILNAVGWRAGDMFGKKVINRRTVKDIKKFDKAKTEKLMQTATELGIDLTPAEASDLGSLVAQQTRLGMSFDDAGDIIRQFYNKRAQQVDMAVNREIGKAPPSSVVGGQARAVGKQYVDDALAARETAAGPLYNLARNKSVIPEKEFMKFEEDDYIRGIIDKVVSDPKYGLLDVPRNSLQVIDQTKKLMDDEISTAIRAGKKYEAEVLGKKRASLVGLADNKFPGYKEARDMFRLQTGPVREAEDSLLGQIAKTGNTKLSSVANRFLSSKDIDVLDVMDARRIFVSQGKEREWNDLINVYLRKQWEDIRLPQSGSEVNKGANFKRSIFGTKRQQNIMEAAMGPGRYRSFKDLMDVLEATGRVPKGQSMTEPAQRAAKAESQEVAPIANAAKLDIADPLSSFNIRQWWIDAKVSDWQSQIARVITNPGSISELEKLRKLKSLNPASQSAISIASTAIVKGLYGGADKALSSPQQSIPNILNRSGPL